MGEFESISDESSLDARFKASNQQPVVIFKHSTACPISAAAHNQMEKVSYPVSILVVQGNRELSNEVATRTGIPHESPQVIVLKNGAAVWSASHWDVTADAVQEAVNGPDGKA